MKHLLATLLIALLVLTSALGCGGLGEKGKNKDKDRPKPAETTP